MQVRLVPFIVFVFSGAVSIAQSWVQLDDFPGTSRDDGVAFVLGNKAYCGTGLDVGFQVTRDFYAFDFTSETWSTITPLPMSKNRQYSTAQGIGGMGYVFGGLDASNNYLNDLWRYDPTLDTWVELPSLPGAGRSGASSFTLSNVFYVYGGKSDSSAALNELWAFDIVLNGWSQLASIPMGQGMWRGVGASSSGKGYVLLGEDSSSTFITEMYCYDPTLDSWTTSIGITLNERGYAYFAQTGDFLLVYGGVNNGGFLGDVERINLQTLSYDALTAPPCSLRRGGMGFASVNHFYITAGLEMAGRLKETWKAESPLSLSSIDGFADVTPYQYHNQLIFNAGESTIDRIVLYNQQGQIVAVSDFEDRVSLDVIETGIYFYEVSLGFQVSKGKVYVTSAR